MVAFFGGLILQGESINKCRGLGGLGDVKCGGRGQDWPAGTSGVDWCGIRPCTGAGDTPRGETAAGAVTLIKPHGGACATVTSRNDRT